ncbi:hypothetical protein HK099_007262 [Clydaea vesicula]|uniref:Uncharacterized protein n=1 Tax=Clydaea vesicula TaxID=447962 RepID=A0AAD5TX16_9FUNG|nr:hypothetical protein HK099_007262 [Clydaea vesicula]KAJ3381352.1 hypothetical protein HDU92_005448 [Lobulomyces angularis]
MDDITRIKPQLEYKLDEKEESTTELQNKITLDELGPMVVQSDGTMVRITDWQTKTPKEKEQIIRLISKRNKARLESLNS